MAWSGPDGPSGTVVVAVADGHGSRKSFRSDIGARLAVDIALQSGQAMAQRHVSGERGADGSEMPASLVTEIVDQWVAAVQGDLAVWPVGEEDLTALEQAEGASARLAVESNPLLPYGATLLLAVVLDRSALFLQLGDGDILVAGRSRRVVRPLPGDSRLLGNETTSLCTTSAERDFRIAWLTLDADDTAVIVLATDGLANAYPDEGSFLRVGSDLVERILTTGADQVAGELEGYLREASAHSGDDVTMAVVLLGPAQAEIRSGT